MFNDIVIQRFDKDNNRIQNLPVPIAYGSKQKYIVKNARSSKEEEKLQILLPQMSFLMTNMAFEPGRNINPVNRNYFQGEDKKIKVQFAMVPMVLDFELYIMTRTQDDAFQIVEQIVPYFRTSLTNNVKLHPDMGMNLDVRTEMTGMQQQDDFEGGNEDSRVLIWSMSFQMHAWYAGPISNSGLIKRVQVDLHPVNNDEWDNAPTQSRVVARPGLTADGQPTTDPALTIPYREIEAEDPYGFIEEVFFFQPGVRRDAHGNDEPV